MKHIRQAALICLLAVAGCNRPRVSDTTAQEATTARPVSIIELIANPKKYDGRKVYVLGFANFASEGNVLYLHAEDYRMNLTKNALWLSVSPEISAHKNGLMHKYIWVSGTFDAKNTGHGGLNSGAIRDIIGIGAHAEPDGTEATNGVTLFLKK